MDRDRDDDDARSSSSTTKESGRKKAWWRLGPDKAEKARKRAAGLLRELLGEGHEDLIDRVLATPEDVEATLVVLEPSGALSISGSGTTLSVQANFVLEPKAVFRLASSLITLGSENSSAAAFSVKLLVAMAGMGLIAKKHEGKLIELCAKGAEKCDGVEFRGTGYVLSDKVIHSQVVTTQYLLRPLMSAGCLKAYDAKYVNSPAQKVLELMRQARTAIQKKRDEAPALKELRALFDDAWKSASAADLELVLETLRDLPSPLAKKMYKECKRQVRDREHRQDELEAATRLKSAGFEYTAYVEHGGGPYVIQVNSGCTFNPGTHAPLLLASALAQINSRDFPAGIALAKIRFLRARACPTPLRAADLREARVRAFRKRDASKDLLISEFCKDTVADYLLSVQACIEQLEGAGKPAEAAWAVERALPLSFETKLMGMCWTADLLNSLLAKRAALTQYASKQPMPATLATLDEQVAALGVDCNRVLKTIDLAVNPGAFAPLIELMGILGLESRSMANARLVIARSPAVALPVRKAHLESLASVLQAGAATKGADTEDTRLTWVWLLDARDLMLILWSAAEIAVEGSDAGWGWKHFGFFFKSKGMSIAQDGIHQLIFNHLVDLNRPDVSSDQLASRLETILEKVARSSKLTTGKNVDLTFAFMRTVDVLWNRSDSEAVKKCLPSALHWKGAFEIAEVLRICLHKTRHLSAVTLFDMACELAQHRRRNNEAEAAAFAALEGATAIVLSDHDTVDSISTRMRIKEAMSPWPLCYVALYKSMKRRTEVHTRSLTYMLLTRSAESLKYFTEAAMRLAKRDGSADKWMAVFAKMKEITVQWPGTGMENVELDWADVNQRLKALSDAQRADETASGEG